MIERADNFMAGLGVEVYRVGGSVRDELLGRRAKDADYVVFGEDLHDLGYKLAYAARRLDKRSSTRPLKLRDGRQAGWRVSARGIGCLEIMLPRTDISTGPGHRDFEIIVDPSLSLADDARRRDFTFNALYRVIAHPDGLRTSTTAPDGTAVENILDPTGRGLHDLQRGLIATTHRDSFRDDPLRTLRALRFVARGFELSFNTKLEMVRHADAVTGLTANGYASGTVLDEFSKILMGDAAGRALRLARDTGVLAAALPELAPMIGFEQESRYHDKTTDEHTFMALDTAAAVSAPLRVRWALLFHDAGKPATGWIGEDGRRHYYARADEPRAVLVDLGDGRSYNMDHEDMGELIWRAAAKRLNAPRDLRDDVAHLIRHHMVALDGKLKGSKVRRMRVEHGDDMLHDLLMHRACDVSAKGWATGNALKRIADMVRIAQEARDAGVPATVKELAVDGMDAAAVNLHGRSIGEALRAVLHEVASQPNERTLSREWQLARLETLAHG